MNENILAINIPNAVSIVVMAALGGVVLAYLRKAAASRGGIVNTPGADAPGR